MHREENGEVCWGVFTSFRNSNNFLQNIDTLGRGCFPQLCRRDCIKPKNIVTKTATTLGSYNRCLEVLQSGIFFWPDFVGPHREKVCFTYFVSHFCSLICILGIPPTSLRRLVGRQFFLKYCFVQMETDVRVYSCCPYIFLFSLIWATNYLCVA